MRCKDVQFTMDLGNNPISSLCFKPGNEDMIFVSSGTEVKCFDDDGDVKIINSRQQRIFKTLRDGHTSICSSVQFLPWRPWEVITGGLDSKLVMWDFSKGRPFKIVDFGMSNGGSSDSTEQCVNPPFVHALAVPDLDMLDNTNKVCVVARGDGVVDIINVESELGGSIRSKNPSKSKTKPSSKDANNQEQNGKNRLLHLDSSLGGHTASVSSVTFSSFGDRGKLIISGGNDKSIKVWDWTKLVDDAGESSSNRDDFRPLNIDLSKKVNWLCTTPNDSEYLVVCDTTKVVKIFTIL